VPSKALRRSRRLARNNAAVMRVPVLVIGVKMIGDAISGFSA
jgi:hypothetical protein